MWSKEMKYHKARAGMSRSAGLEDLGLPRRDGLLAGRPHLNGYRVESLGLVGHLEDFNFGLERICVSIYFY